METTKIDAVQNVRTTRIASTIMKEAVMREAERIFMTMKMAAGIPTGMTIDIHRTAMPILIMGEIQT